MLITLTETRTRYNSIVLSANKQPLFSISQSTVRGDYGVSVRSELPGARVVSNTEADPGSTSYSPAEERARRNCAHTLQMWLAQTFGINATVEVADSAGAQLCQVKAAL